MTTHILTEQDWESFVEENVLPACTPRHDSACMFALVGDLGAGKTTFSKTFLHTLGVKQHVQSPTFSIINSYDIAYGEFTKVFHIDLYRVDDLKELEVLHVADIFNNPKHIVVVEWADKAKAMIPASAVWMNFEHDTIETRKVTIEDENNEIPQLH